MQPTSLPLDSLIPVPELAKDYDENRQDHANSRLPTLPLSRPSMPPTLALELFSKPNVNCALADMKGRWFGATWGSLGLAW